MQNLTDTPKIVKRSVKNKSRQTISSKLYWFWQNSLDLMLILNNNKIILNYELDNNIL